MLLWPVCTLVSLMSGYQQPLEHLEVKAQLTSTLVAKEVCIQQVCRCRNTAT
jgi:hypothetical protein